jgi:hypothetical protein
MAAVMELRSTKTAPGFMTGRSMSAAATAALPGTREKTKSIAPTQSPMTSWSSRPRRAALSRSAGAPAEAMAAS